MADKYTISQWPSLDFAEKDKRIAELTEQMELFGKALERIAGYKLSEFTEPYDMALACVETAQEAIAKAEKK